MAGSNAVIDPAMQALISVINDSDKAAFFGALTMSDAGTDLPRPTGPARAVTAPRLAAE